MKDDFLCNALFYAACNGHPEVVHYLLEKSSSGSKEAFFATRHEQVARVFIEAGQDVNATDESGMWKEKKARRK